jgi:NAD(P)-dependent dehydrogenase (short-subunit alcohol dehydrogenase family)
MSLLAAIKGTRGASGFGFASTAEDVTRDLDLSGRTVLVTGVASGIGHETARVLAARGAHVIGAGRTLESARAALSRIDGRTTAVACELSEPASVRACVAAVAAMEAPLDALIANAGIMALPRLVRHHGYEMQFFTNHIGHFLLVTGLLDRLAPGGRVVMLSSEAHRAAPPGGIEFDNLTGERGYSPWRAYGQSKMANLLFARELARRLDGSGRSANAVHPGVIRTNLGRHMNPVAIAAFGALGGLFAKTVPQGAATSCYVAVHPGMTASGGYFADCNAATPRADGSGAATAARLWAVSEEIAAGLA